MRAIGYEPATAIADLIDNSITAGARNVSIRFPPGMPTVVAVIDDGDGMRHDELMNAMRHGSQNPNLPRAQHDLGRFGLGMKTASMSQARRLTVCTRRDGILSAMVWDLDDVSEANEWVAGELSRGEIEDLPYLRELLEHRSGTMVLWEKLDKIAAGDRGDGQILSERMTQVADHLGLVFHRYLTGPGPKLSIDLNRQPIVPLDPFLEDLGSTAEPEEHIEIDGAVVLVRAFTLPHISRLTRQQIEKAGGEAGLRRQQGFYVYRDRRLIIWGTWFRLFRGEELTKLTRVRVDVPNALDSQWSLDIKKSVATPPAPLRDRLKNLVPAMVHQSRETNAWRGRSEDLKGISPIWKRVEGREGILYEIDRDHPLVAALRREVEGANLAQLDGLLRAVAGSVPVEVIYNDRAADRIGHKDGPQRMSSDALEDLARQMLGAFDDRPEEQERLLNGLAKIEPFSHQPEVVLDLQRRLRE